MNHPYLVTDIPFGNDGHVMILEPGSSLGEAEVAVLLQMYRDEDYQVTADRIQVARDSIQWTGRNGRAILVLHRVDTARMTAEQIEDTRDKLLERLGQVGELAEHESVAGRVGTLVTCPLLSVWSDVDGMKRLPCTRTAPSVATPPTPA